MIRSIRGILIYTATVLGAAVAYFIYAYTVFPPVPERETYLSEIGEGFGEVGLWALLFIYARTLLKLLLGRGALARRLLPDYAPPAAASPLLPAAAWPPESASRPASAPAICWANN